MVIYIIYFIILAVLAVEYEFRPFKQGPFFVVVIFMLGIMAGLQGPNVSKDYSNYQAIFFSVDSMIDQMKMRGGFPPPIEPGCLLIIATLRKIFEINYIPAIFLFFSFSSLMLKSTLIKKISINPFLVFLFYFSHYFFLSEMTQIRMGLATSIFFVAVKYLLEGKKITYVLLILLATFIHYSALMYLIVLLLSTNKVNRYLYAGILMLSVVFAFMRIPFFDYIGGDIDLGKLAGYKGVAQYMEYRKINPFNTIVLVNLAFIVYLLFIVPKAMLLKDKKMVLIVKCNVVSVFLLYFFFWLTYLGL